MYRTPPITEAVLEFQLSDAVPIGVVERTKAQLLDRFPLAIEERNYHVHIDVDRGTVNVDNEHMGFRLSGPAGSNEIVILKRNALSTSILAPYRNWEQLQNLTENSWSIFKKNSGNRGCISRIGLRYINRIDIPIQKTEEFEIKDYLTIAYEAPQPPLAPSTEFLVSLLTRIGDGDECGVRISSSSQASPVPMHSGLILDIDVFTDKPISFESEDLWGIVERMRNYKNSVFELCVTDRARELFARG